MSALKGRLHTLRAQAGAPVVSAVPSVVPPVADRVDRLRARLPSVGAARVSDTELAVLLGGEVAAPGLIVVESRLPLAHAHGVVQLGAIRTCALSSLHPQWSAHDVESLVFLDTETSGLAGGAGTVVFLLAMARVCGNELHLRQYFLSAFAGEHALVTMAVEYCSDASAFVSYNGKSFDIPMLCTRSRLAGVANRFADLPHLDLLHITRRAFSKQWADCRLQTAEHQLLEFNRVDDLPGSEVPEVWFEWLRFGQVERVPDVVEHNRLDVLSLVALAARLADVYAQPHDSAVDALALAKHFACTEREEKALALLGTISNSLDVPAQMELARLHRRQGDVKRALELWEKLAAQGVTEAALNLTKFHEHVLHDVVKAAQFASQLLAAEPASPSHVHRYERLQRKLRTRCGSP